MPPDRPTPGTPGPGPGKGTGPAGRPTGQPAGQPLGQPLRKVQSLRPDVTIGSHSALSQLLAESMGNAPSARPGASSGGSKLWIVIVVVLVAALALGAFVAMKMQGPPAGGEGPAPSESTGPSE